MRPCTSFGILPVAKIMGIISEDIWLVGWLLGFLWHINIWGLFNVIIHFYCTQLNFKQFRLARVHSLIVKNIYISSNSVYSNSSNSANSV